MLIAELRERGVRHSPSDIAYEAVGVQADSAIVIEARFTPLAESE
ncbi:hypothetical protein [Deinococcus taeanensis]|nr:hypothetical protein [Deinococcus taeanensis]